MLGLEPAPALGVLTLGVDPLGGRVEKLGCSECALPMMKWEREK